MSGDKKIYLIIGTIPVCALLMVFMVSTLRFDLALSPVERILFNFNYENIPKIPEISSISTSNIRNPFTISASSRTDYPGVPLIELSPPVTHKKVSLILINENIKMVIIDGKVLKIGDVIDNQRIARIEKNRVLLKNKEGEKWLLIE
jgi:hypothetical protein